MNARTMLQMGEAAVGALETIEKLTHVGGDKAVAALAAIRAVLDTLKQGFEGKLSAQAVLTRVEEFHEHITTNDAAAIAELRKRFGVAS